MFWSQTYPGTEDSKSCASKQHVPKPLIWSLQVPTSSVAMLCLATVPTSGTRAFTCALM